MPAPPPRVIAAVIAVLLAMGLGAVFFRDTGSSRKVAARSTTTTSSTEAPTTTGPQATSAPSTQAPGTTTPVPSALARTFAEIEAQVSELRGLPWKAPLDIQVANDAEFVRQLNVVIQRDIHPDRMQGDGETLKVLKLIPQSTDYIKLYNDLLGGAVLGFYDPKTKKLLVRSNGSLTPEQRITIAHEMDHALTDQHFNFGAATDQLDKEDKSEAGSGYSALLEGDAKTLEAQWASKYLTAKERAQATGETGDAADVYRRTPPFVVDSLLFPYTTGRAFVQSRYRAGGWAAVNELYRRPPDSTQVVIHPNLYAAGKTWSTPAMPNLAAATGCASVRTGTAGEFVMTELVDQYLTEQTATAASSDWNGDAFATIRCGAARGFADRWVSDADSAGALTSALGEWSQRWSGNFQPPAPDGRFAGPQGAGRIVHAGSRVDLILADDSATVDKISAALGD